MKQATNIALSFILALLPAAAASGQETIHVGFDGPSSMPPGSSLYWGYYVESLVQVHGGIFVRRWSGDPAFPDNGTAYLQPYSEPLAFAYGINQRFNPLSVDLALYSRSSMDPVTVRCIRYGCSALEILASTEFSVSGVIDNDGRPAFQTFYFGPEFQNILHLVVQPASPGWSLDNLVIFIPEPSSGTLLAFGALGLGLLRQRHSSNALHVSGDCQP